MIILQLIFLWLFSNPTYYPVGNIQILTDGSAFYYVVQYDGIFMTDECDVLTFCGLEATQVCSPEYIQHFQKVLPAEELNNKRKF